MAMSKVKARLLWVIHVGADGVVKSQMMPSSMPWARGSKSVRRESKLKVSCGEYKG